jgi:hypothetical protein
MGMDPTLAGIIGGVVAGGIVLALARFFWLWFWRVNVIVSRLERIEQALLQLGAVREPAAR